MWLMSTDNDHWSLRPSLVGCMISVQSSITRCLTGWEAKTTCSERERSNIKVLHNKFCISSTKSSVFCRTTKLVFLNINFQRNYPGKVWSERKRGGTLMIFHTGWAKTRRMAPARSSFALPY